MGHVSLSKEQAADPEERLQREATAYALKKFNAEENERVFWIGCSDFSTNRAFIWTIEAARALAGNKPDLALDLLNMARTRIREPLEALRKTLEFYESEFPKITSYGHAENQS